MTQLKELKWKAELEALQAKINPHFLYNSINSAISLVHNAPNKAEEMLLNLAAFFRYSLNVHEGHLSTVEQEIGIAETYLKIEKLRFEDLLEYEIEVDQECNSLILPRFLIQPLLENAVKHGIKSLKRGKIGIKVLKVKNGMSIRIFDNGPPFSENLEPNFGIQSCMDKLNLLFPNKHEMAFVNETPKYVSIDIENSKVK